VIHRAKDTEVRVVPRPRKHSGPKMRDV
jgi:hypothetical protein